MKNPERTLAPRWGAIQVPRRERRDEELRLNKKIVGIMLVVAFFSISTAYAAMDVPALNTFSAVWEAITESNSEIATLEAKIVELEAKVAELEESGSQATLALSIPDFESKWKTILPGETKEIRHNLGTRKLFVYILGKDPMVGGFRFHQIYYGMEKHQGYYMGLYWDALTKNKIRVIRGSSDTSWEYFRVYIWKLS